jgi:hypothetical protein
MRYPYIKLFFSTKVFSNPYINKNKWWAKYIPFLSGYLVCRHAHNTRKKAQARLARK